ncbi:MAG: DUF485 domain-containing protein [Zoogloeaceae bacterium]|jgi:uncharacterized membrane protein (DUF485 family)|nr:DUF485 domain-containing protein [Zoogloeaceae bacterium]
MTQQTLTQRIMANPQYQSVVRERSRFGWALTVLLCIAYYGFTLIIAFDKPLLATPISGGMVTSWGIPVGFGLIFLSVVMTGIYVRRSNHKFDAVIAGVLAKEVKS